MSEIAENAVVNLIVADFANDDGSGKINVLGKGVAILGFDARAGVTSRFTVAVDVWLPTRFAPAEFPVELALLEASGDLVAMPGPGGAQNLRIAQVVNIQRSPMTPAASAEHIGSGSRINFNLDFSNGLPLVPNGRYIWRVQLDGDETRSWTYPLAVAGPGKGPIIG